MREISRNIITVTLLSISPMAAMALTSKNADACFKCGTGTQVCKCATTGAGESGSASCIPEPGTCTHGSHCTLSGMCIG